ncbi:aspartyl/asparaginyl beta-hydroxylase domain-containing protein [Acidisoma silvae]|uniref:Aspartyl/asparaginyl beta-hydroxylase domain-containing protein n=1 Tax=Acidisoma silvae TaxID=2802396 RepID=A0A963YW82_9PROT|nr:aspartyl/asparaginyl beta-hydroxylase domain-containing protein [Acidisoma silvae]MCB8878278.1 aspartyl/asparaginyl beta-hydroxylase domain-containing protein [Acidisoma silvae]
MIEPFRLIRSGVDVAPLVEQLAAHPELWGQQKARLVPGSPHSETVDIWVRFRDVDAYVAEYGSDMARFVDEHESVWLPPALVLPGAVAIATNLAGDRRLGGVLITKTPPGGQIKPHVDGGWHAQAHDKFYVAIQADDGCLFRWDGSDLIASPGDIWEFRNDIPHSVENHSSRDRLSMIVCLRRDL